MAVRLQEIHPSLVHLPITLLPLAVGADALGHVTGKQSLRDVGRWAMPLAAASAAVSALFGLVAQEEVKAEGRAHEILATHRTLDAALVATAAAMAAWRLKHDEPSAAYFGLGAAALGAMGYSAYLGGKTVYEHGVGVKSADGLRRDDSPELAPGRVREFARAVVEDVERAIPHAVEDVRRGDVVPTITGDGDVEQHGPGGPGSEPRSTRE